MPEVRGVIHFYFPKQPGDVVPVAGPVIGAAAQGGRGWQHLAAVGNFREVEPGVARADLGQGAGLGRCVPTIMSILALGLVARARIVVAVEGLAAKLDAGVVERPRGCLGQGRGREVGHQDEQQEKRQGQGGEGDVFHGEVLWDIVVGYWLTVFAEPTERIPF